MSIQVFIISSDVSSTDIVLQVRPAEGELGNYQLRFVADKAEARAGQQLFLGLPAGYGAAPLLPCQVLAVSTQAEGNSCFDLHLFTTEQCYPASDLQQSVETFGQTAWPLATVLASPPGAVSSPATRELQHLLAHLLSVARELMRADALPSADGHALRAVAGPSQHLKQTLGPTALAPPAGGSGMAAFLPAGNSSHACWLRRLYALLDAHLDKSDLSVEWLAMQLHMSRKTLLRKLQRLLHLSPRDVIQQYRLRRGAELLRAGYPVAEVAYTVGFNTPAYFGLCFKELYHVTPRQFAGGK
jgi:AraC-like DNA-binding protein